MDLLSDFFFCASHSSSLTLFYSDCKHYVSSETVDSVVVQCRKQGFELKPVLDSQLWLKEEMSSSELLLFILTWLPIVFSVLMDESVCFFLLQGLLRAQGQSLMATWEPSEWVCYFLRTLSRLQNCSSEFCNITALGRFSIPRPLICEDIWRCPSSWPKPRCESGEPGIGWWKSNEMAVRNRLLTALLTACEGGCEFWWQSMPFIWYRNIFSQFCDAACVAYETRYNIRIR